MWVLYVLYFPVCLIYIRSHTCSYKRPITLYHSLIIPICSVLRFSVEPTNGTIVTTGVLDYELGSRYDFYLEAKDGGGIFYEKRSSVTIIVNINDNNDNSPVFTNLPYKTTIDENQLPSNFIFKASTITFC